jgi:hypothetical protein
MGAYASRTANPLKEWYVKDPQGRTYIRIPDRFEGGGIRDTSHFPLRPARDDIIAGQIHGKTYHQYDLTPQQYDSLIKLTATLCRIFPQIKCDYPRDEAGQLITTKLPDDKLATYQGLLGHYHVQLDKQDPGPAFDWDKVVNSARALMK